MVPDTPGRFFSASAAGFPRAAAETDKRELDSAR